MSAFVDGPSAEARFGLGWERLAAEDARRSADLDVLAKGKKAGPKHGGHRALTDDQVREVKRLRASGFLMSAIGRRFGVTEQTISKILSGRAYAGVR